MRIEFYKVLTEVAGRMSEQLKLFFVRKLETRLAVWRAEEINLIEEMALKSLQREEWTSLNIFLDLLWSYLFDATQR